MKPKIILLSYFIILFTNNVYSQRLEVIRTYWDWSRTQLHEIYTVIAGTPKKHGYYKEYNQVGALWNTAHYKRGILHGQYVQYCGGESDRIWYITNYINGKKNGEKITYSLDEKLPNCISSIAIYKDDDCIECTDYYEKSKNRNYKKYHFKYIGDRLYKTYWYENGNIESKEILAYNEIEALIFSLFMSEDGKMISKFEDKVYSYYDEDGINIIRKEYKTTGTTEFYQNGELVKSIRPINEGGYNFTETKIYKNGEVISTVTKDKNGYSIEELRKDQKLAERYDELYSLYKEKICPDLDSLYEKMCDYNHALEIQEKDKYGGPCRKAAYESKEKIDSLINYLNKHVAKTYITANRYRRFSKRGILYKVGDNKYAYKKTEKEIHALEELLDTFDIYTLEKEFYTLFEIKDVIEKIKPDLYYIECSYTYYWGQQGYSDNVPNKHSYSYEAYLHTTRYLTSKLKDKDVYETLKILKQYAIVCSKMRQWYNQRIGKIERAFKKAESEEEMLTIFLSENKK